MMLVMCSLGEQKILMTNKNYGISICLCKME